MCSEHVELLLKISFIAKCCTYNLFCFLCVWQRNQPSQDKTGYEQEQKLWQATKEDMKTWKKHRTLLLTSTWLFSSDTIEQQSLTHRTTSAAMTTRTTRHYANVCRIQLFLRLKSALTKKLKTDTKSETHIPAHTHTHTHTSLPFFAIFKKDANMWSCSFVKHILFEMIYLKGRTGLVLL